MKFHLQYYFRLHILEYLPEFIIDGKIIFKDNIAQGNQLIEWYTISC